MNFGRILVVEDDESLRRVTQAQLEKSLYQTAVAGDATEALEILEKAPKELVLADLNLPGMSGLELLQEDPGRLPGDHGGHGNRLRVHRDRRGSHEMRRLRLPHQAGPSR